MRPGALFTTTTTSIRIVYKLQLLRESRSPWMGQLRFHPAPWYEARSKCRQTLVIFDTPMRSTFGEFASHLRWFPRCPAIIPTSPILESVFYFTSAWGSSVSLFRFSLALALPWPPLSVCFAFFSSVSSVSLPLFPAICTDKLI